MAVVYMVISVRSIRMCGVKSKENINNFRTITSQNYSPGDIYYINILILGNRFAHLHYVINLSHISTILPMQTLKLSYGANKLTSQHATQHRHGPWVTVPSLRPPLEQVCRAGRLRALCFRQLSLELANFFVINMPALSTQVRSYFWLEYCIADFVTCDCGCVFYLVALQTRVYLRLSVKRVGLGRPIQRRIMAISRQ